MKILLAWLTVGAWGSPGFAQAPDSMALGAALADARTVIDEGDIQVSPLSVEVGGLVPEPGSWMPEYLTLAQAARVAGLSYGHDRVAVRCVPPQSRGCRAQGTFRGLVHVAGIKIPKPDSIVVILRMFKFTRRPDAEYDHIYMQIDEVHVARRERGGWQIVKALKIAES